MIVAELEEALALLPADLTVVMRPGGMCSHIRLLAKAPWRRPSGGIILPGTQLVDGRHPPHLILGAVAHNPYLPALGWWEAHGADVDWATQGRWPAKPQRRDTPSGHPLSV